MGANKRDSRFTRRGFLGAGLLFPFLSKGKTPVTNDTSEKNGDDDEYATMLTANGGVVRVRKTVIKEAKVVKNKMSNKSLLSWLKLKDKG